MRDVTAEMYDCKIGENAKEKGEFRKVQRSDQLDVNLLKYS